MKALLLALTLLSMIEPNPADAIEVQGHRGARAVLPENSLPALKYALEIGVDTLEFDMGVTADGVVVVVHDQQINPLICQYKDGSVIEGDLWVHQLTLEQIKQFDCGSKQNPRFEKQVTIAGTEIPTLAEVFEMVASSGLANAKTVAFNIETKSDPSTPHAQPSAEKFVEAVLEVVQQYGLESRVTLQSFNPATLIAANEIAPNLQLSALFREKPDNWLDAAEAVGADIISPHHSLLGRRDVEQIQEAGLAVIPWTANSKRQWTRLIRLGVDGIITDDPEALLKFIESLEAPSL
jgi:glycerophosphoryl diester phosphodiesterase